MKRVPSELIELLKKLVAGLFASESATPFSWNASPVKPRSPSYATAPSRVFTIPAGGVTNPLTVRVMVVVPETVAVAVVHDQVARRLRGVAYDHDQRPAARSTLVEFGVDCTFATR